MDNPVLSFFLIDSKSPLAGVLFPVVYESG